MKVLDNINTMAQNLLVFFKRPTLILSLTVGSHAELERVDSVLCEHDDSC